MSHNHFTLSFPLQSPADAAALVGLLPRMMPNFFEAQDRIGTIHYSLFSILSEKTLLFLGDFDGEFGPLIADLAEFAGPLFDLILQHVALAPPAPVAGNIVAFVEWNAEHLLHAATVYSAYPDATVQDIKSFGVRGGDQGEPRTFLVILPMKSRLAFFEAQLLLRARARWITKHLDGINRLHFAQFVPLEDNQIGLFTVYDGSFDDCMTDLAASIGQFLDLLLRFIKGAPPIPCRTHLRELIDFAAHATRTPIGFFQAYPGLSVRDILALPAPAPSGC
jgi:hypothetical protein